MPKPFVGLSKLIYLKKRRKMLSDRVWANYVLNIFC